MTDPKPCIICVAITGSLPTKENNPAVPITVEEQIESTQESFEAGATIAHCHVRNDDETVPPGFFRIIARSGDLPNDMIMVGAHVPEESAMMVRDAILENKDEIIAGITAHEENDKYVGMDLVAIEDGAYDNVRKVVWLLIATGVAEIVLFSLSVVFGTDLPLSPVQLLWLNLVTNGIQDVALAFEKGEPGVLGRRPRSPDERIFNRLMIEEVVTSGVFVGVVGFAVFYVLVGPWGYETFDARNILLLLLVLFENVHAFNVRSETRSAFRIPLTANRLLVGAVVLSQGIHIASMFIPGWRDVLGVSPVSFATWAVLLGITLSLLLVVEIYKHLRGRALAERIYHPPGQAGGGEGRVAA